MKICGFQIFCTFKNHLTIVRWFSKVQKICTALILSVSQPAVRPGSTRCMALEIQHSKGNRVGFMKLLFRRRFTHCAMAIPFILHSLPCSSIFL